MLKKLSSLTRHAFGIAGAIALAFGTSAFAADFDPAAAESAVTVEMLDDGHDDYDEGAVDAIGAQVYEYLSFGGDKSVLSAEQVAAAEGYYDRYETSPFFTISNLWVLVCAFLVFIMHLGFSTVESGMCQRKNTVNILFKNVFIICVGIVAYAIWGFNAMYPSDWIAEGFFAFGSPISGTAADNADFTYGGTGLCQTGWADFIFQAMFAATAATIVSGAVAERVKLSSFLVFATLLVLIAYPITGSWKWGGGWLADMADFAGSSVVHAFGGFAALACVLVLGPRAGKYAKNGAVKPILPHNLPLAAIGVFLLWFGWFGFNGGSVLSADPGLISYVIVTTSLGAACGGLVSMFTSWAVLRKPDLSMSLNGILAGLVGITAGADNLSILGACIAGGVAGGLVVFSVIFLDKLRIDDPVGAISVHGTCGVWGTIAVGIPFLQIPDAEVSLVTQIIGTLSISAFAFIFSLIVFGILKAVMGVRVDAQEEDEGLDVTEHGSPAYN